LLKLFILDQGNCDGGFRFWRIDPLAHIIDWVSFIDGSGGEYPNHTLENFVAFLSTNRIISVRRPPM